MERLTLSETHQPAAGTWSGYELPTDILIAIMTFLTPQDILALRKVCKAVSNASYERSVWINALRRLCIEQDIYTPSFPCTEMTIEELEHAATASKRFRARLRREFMLNETVQPIFSRTLRLPQSAQDFRHLRFVPGGRFLLTISECTVCLWDLGNRATGIELHPITSLEIEGITEIQSLRVRARQAADEVLVILSSDAPNAFRVHVFTIFPPAPNPVFTPLVTDLVLPMPDERFTTLCATSQHIVISTSSVTILWNFISDSWTSWPAEPQSDNNMFYFCDANLLILRTDQSTIHIAAIPRLHPRAQTDSLVPPLLPALSILSVFKLHRLDDAEEDLQRCFSGVSLVFHGREISTPDQPLRIDIVSELTNARALLSHYELRSFPSTDHGVGARVELVPLGEHALDCLYISANTVQFEWVGRQEIQSFFVQENAVHVCLANLDSLVLDSPSAAAAGVLSIPGLLDGELANDFCSFSGRVCTRLPGSGEDGASVVVLDYLRHKNDSQC